MTQEMGSLGKDVALQTAEALGLTVVRDEMISDIVAGKMKKRKRAIRRFKEGNASLRERLGVSRKNFGGLFCCGGLRVRCQGRRAHPWMGRYLPFTRYFPCTPGARLCSLREASSVAHGKAGHRQ